MNTSVLWTALRGLVLGLFACVTLLIVWSAGTAVLSATGLSADPHGYSMIFGFVTAIMLSPIALCLWLLYRALRRRRGN